jgi:hypothetical protein
MQKKKEIRVQITDLKKTRYLSSNTVLRLATLKVRLSWQSWPPGLISAVFQQNLGLHNDTEVLKQNVDAVMPRMFPFHNSRTKIGKAKERKMERRAVTNQLKSLKVLSVRNFLPLSNGLTGV